MHALRSRRGRLPLSLLAAAAGLAIAFGTGCGDGAETSPSPVVGPLGDRRDLPVDGRVHVEGLTAPVDVVRDEDGRPHIYAFDIADAMRVQGYLVAGDRTAQLELLRRLAEGRLAEIFADLDASVIDDDIAQRHIGLARVAKVEYDAMASSQRALLDAYADGVSQQFRRIRSGALPLPEGMTKIPLDAFTDWTAVDTLAIGRYQSQLLSYDADSDLDVQAFVDGCRTTFTAADPDPLKAKRAGLERDLLRFAPATAATTTDGYPKIAGSAAAAPWVGARGGAAGASATAAATASKTGAAAAGLATALRARADRVAATLPYRRALAAVRRILAPEGFGSNDFAAGPSRSATGHVLVASDPHLSLTAPAVFWPVSVDVTAPPGADASYDLALGGIAFPGIPGIILGHNAHIGWGATVAGYDVSDVYDETLVDDGGALSVVYQGKHVPLQTVKEEIAVKGGATRVYDVAIVPHHGPIFPTITADHQVAKLDPVKGAVSMRWTGLDPSDEFGAILDLLRASDVDGARQALERFGVGAQNWIVGDDAGNILWTSHARIPERDPRAFTWDAATYQGSLPCLVLPGDGSAEWKSDLPDDMVPWEKNPASGTLATANNDPIGDTLDNDPSNDTLPDGTPMFLQCFYDVGFREARIKSRLGQPDPLTVDDLASIQGDVRSPLGAALAPKLFDALSRAEEERTKPGSHPALASIVSDPAYQPMTMQQVRDALLAWGAAADYRSASGIDPDTNEPLPIDPSTPEGLDAAASQATLLFNAWVVRLIARTFGDELSAMGATSVPGLGSARALLYLFESYPPALATYDPATSDSALWDDLTTPAVETRDEQVLRAMLDALAFLSDAVGPDLGAYRWGALHTVRFNAIVPIWGKLSIPPSGDKTFPKGFPRPGGAYVVDASGFSLDVPLDHEPSFVYRGGPTQRFVVELDPAGPKAQNALPGGNVWDAASPHFRDEAELWRKNQTHPVPFALHDVIAAKESRIVME